MSQTRSNITNPSLLPSRKKKPKLNTPSLLLLNARSLTSKVGLLQVYVAHYNPSLIAVTESWANCTIPDSVYTLLGYSLYRNDRKNQAGGGVLLYVNNRLKSEINDDLTHSDYEESIWCNVWLTKDVKLLIGVVYRPPGLLPMQNQNLVNLLHKTRSYSKSEYTIVVGDFNYPSIDWERFSFGPSCDQFVDAVLDLNLTQHVLQPTRNDAILDLVFSSDPEVVSNVDILEPLGNSDHNMVLCDLNLPNSLTHKTAKKSRNYRKANWELFQENLAMVDWEKVFSSGEPETVDKVFSNHHPAH